MKTGCCLTDTLNKILYLLKKNGLSEAEFSRRISIARSALTDWKTGRTKSYNKHLPKIAEVLGVSVEELMDDPEEYKIGSPQLLANNVEHICKVLDCDIEDRLIMWGLPEDTIIKLKKGMTPTAEILEKLSGSFHVPPSVLLGIEEFDMEKYSKRPSLQDLEEKRILHYYFRLSEEDRDYIKGEMVRLYKIQTK